MKKMMFGVLMVIVASLMLFSAVLAFHPQTAAPGETPRGPDSVNSNNKPCSKPGLPVAIAAGGNVHCKPSGFCGDGSLGPGEQCDDGNTDNNDLCRNNCQLPFCGDGIQDDGEECDDGNQINDDACKNDCTTNVCGDGVIEDGVEECDDGNNFNLDGCNQFCQIEFCGDGINQLPLGEQCDDGNTNDNDACNNDCTDNVCGDGFIETGVEQCDDGNTNDNDACNNDCTDNICGDSIIEAGVEQCDDGNIANGDGCDSACQLEPSPNCGNGVIDAGEQCDDSNTVSGDGCSLTCQLEVCGNGILDAGEQCDDGNANNNDACKNNCNFNVCGDNVIETGVEECDDGDTNSGDGCSATCITEFCGDGTTQAGLGEQCDDGNTNNNDACRNNCKFPFCGDGITDIGETCDDGNTNNEDACKNDCTNNICGDGILETGVEECDDGNNFNLDGCNQFCQSEFCGDGITQLPLGEQCDDADFNNHDECLNSCQNPACGDGFLWIGNEQCDDGDNANGDGCDANCNFEGGGACLAPVDIMLIIDKSGSMNVLDNGNTRLQNAKSAAITFVNTVNFSKDEVGLASFNELATLNLGLNNSQALITAAINALTASGQTNIGDGIKVGRQELVANGGPTKAMILLSDGAPNAMTLPNGSLRFCFVNPSSPTNCTIYAVNQSNLTKQAGIEIFTIGLGVNNFTENLLKDIATIPSNYFFAPNSTVLESIYLQIAQEICPCQGFDCSINSDECNIGSCDLGTDQCEFNQQPQSTSCEEDSTKCTTQHCDGEGACVVNDTVDVPPAEQCQSFYCNSSDGQVTVNLTGFPLSKPCNTDDSSCTTQHCNGAGLCAVNDTVDVPAPEQCKSFFCDPANGEIKENVSGFPLSTSCEADGNLCTIDHCNGNGQCVFKDPKDCSLFNTQCQQGVCDPSNGLCQPDFSPFPFSTPCQADNNVCTIDHCSGNGACITFDTVDVPPAEECKSFTCDPIEGIKEINFDESTPCSTDDNECTIQHCDGGGSCVINPAAELPPECKTEVIKDSKVSQSMPTSNFGLGRYMIVNSKAGAIDRSYIRIDASLLTSSVSSAKLKAAVYYTGGNATGSGIQAFYCRNHDFIETTINWNNQPLDSQCSLADTFIVPSEVVAGTPETFHEFDLLNETNFEINDGDGVFTIVLRSALENTGLNHNKKYVQYLTKDYSEADFRPKFEVS